MRRFGTSLGPPKKGGSIRRPTPHLDLEHLQDILVEHVQNNGVEKALDFGAYEQVHVSMAVKGPALAQHRRLLRGLFSACPEGLFKYTDLKQVFSAVIARYPDLLRACKEATALDLAKRCAERVLVLMNHARRLSCQVKFEQAMTDCTFIQREALTEIRALPHGDNVEEAPTVASTRVYPSAADNMGRPTSQEKAGGQDFQCISGVCGFCWFSSPQWLR